MSDYKTIESNDLNIISYEKRSSYSAGMMEMGIENSLRCPQTVVRDLDTLIDTLQNQDSMPDAIIINDGSIPPSGRFDIDLLAISCGNAVTSTEDEMHGVQALMALKEPESPFRNIPVIIYYAYDATPFSAHGADYVITSDRIMSSNCVRTALEKVLGVDKIHTPDDAPRLESTVIEPKDKNKADVRSIFLEGQQIDQFQNFVMQASLRLSTKEGLETLMETENFQRLAARYSLELEYKQRDLSKMAESISTLLRNIADDIGAQKIAKQDDAMALIRTHIEASDEPNNQTAYGILLMEVGQSMSDATKTLKADGTVLDFPPEYMGRLRFALENIIVYLKNTDTLGIKAAFDAVVACETMPVSQKAREEIGNIDERQVARDAAQLVRDYMKKLDFKTPQNAEDLLRILDAMTTEDSGHYTTAKYRVQKAIQSIVESAEHVASAPKLTEIQVAAVKSALDEYILDDNASNAAGPKTRELLFRVSDNIRTGMCTYDVMAMVETFGQFYDDKTVRYNWPVMNAQTQTGRILDTVLQVSADPALKTGKKAFRL